MTDNNSDSLTEVIEKSARLLSTSQSRVVEAEQSLARARESLKQAQDDAERDARDIAAYLQKAVDAAKTAQLDEEAEASRQVQEQNDLLGRKLAALKAAYEDASKTAEVHHDQEVRRITSKMSADRDNLLGELLSAGKVLEDALRVATGW